MENSDFMADDELASHYNIEISFITSLYDRGLMEFSIIDEKRALAKAQLRIFERIVRLHNELEINLEGIEAIEHLLSRVEELQTRLTSTSNKLRFYESREK